MLRKQHDTTRISLQRTESSYAQLQIHVILQKLKQSHQFPNALVPFDSVGSCLKSRDDHAAMRATSPRLIHDVYTGVCTTKSVAAELLAREWPLMFRKSPDDATLSYLRHDVRLALIV